MKLLRAEFVANLARDWHSGDDPRVNLNFILWDILERESSEGEGFEMPRENEIIVLKLNLKTR